MSPRDSAGSPFAYVVRTRCTRSTRVKNPRLALSMTCLHARAADITPAGKVALGPLATLPHPAVASAMVVSRPPIRRARFPAMATLHLPFMTGSAPCDKLSNALSHARVFLSSRPSRDQPQGGPAAESSRHGPRQPERVQSGGERPSGVRQDRAHTGR